MVTQPPGDPSYIRRWGGVLLASLFTEGVLGVASAGQGGSGFPPLLLAHLGLGAVVLVVTGWVLSVVLRRRRRPGLIPTAFTATAVVATAATGAIFLVSRFPNGADVDRILALLAIAGAASMIGLGVERAPDESRPRSR